MAQAPDAARPARRPDVVLSGRYEASDEKRHFLVPFEVPAGVRQIHVRYECSDRIDADPHLVGGNTLDIGLFDERGTAVASEGFRGWSGSERAAFTIDAEWATPPYLAGPVGAGTWHVLLGPYKVAPQGLDRRVEIWFDPGLPREVHGEARDVPSRPRRPALPPFAEPGWIRGDLHCHSLYSDGDSWPAEVLAAAAAAGLDFLGVTDHNGVAHHAAYGAGGGALPLVVPGVEVTTYRGHWNAWGADRPFDFRETTDEAVTAAIADAAASGALVSVCHAKPLGPAWEYERARGYRAVEAWNGPWALDNARSLRFWETHLARGERVVAVGGSDAHELRAPGPRRLGVPTTWVRAGTRPTAATILDAIRRGEAFVSASPNGPQLYVDRDGSAIRVRAVGAAGARLRLVGERGVLRTWPLENDDVELRVALPDVRYVRAELVDTAGSMLALSNALWR